MIRIVFVIIAVYIQGYYFNNEDEILSFREIFSGPFVPVYLRGRYTARQVKGMVSRALPCHLGVWFWTDYLNNTDNLTLLIRKVGMIIAPILIVVRLK